MITRIYNSVFDKKLIVFGLCGTGNFVLYYLVFITLIDIIQLQYTIANIMTFIFIMITSYLSNHLIVFKLSFDKLFEKFFTFILSSLFILAISTALLNVAVLVLDIDEKIVIIPIIIICAVLNFYILRYFFKNKGAV